ncbi:MAG: hypothetical protein JSV29_04080 [Candidatus Bathyarchaeota archaeon]|nr:MAG: hypothetical protein JSV29_04080 [Candidatus Bathyarchaeota archaeon]
MIGCFGYLIDVFIFFLFPSYRAISIPGLAVAAIAEVSTIVWLLLKGAKIPSKGADKESKEEKVEKKRKLERED